MLVCPHCNAENPTNHKFCQECGFPLVSRWAVVIDKSQDDGEITTPQVQDNHSLPEIFLGARYPKTISEAKILPNNTFLVKVLDSLPNQPSPLQELMAQQPVVAEPQFLGKPPAFFPTWELWERGGISPEARPYLALRDLLSPHIPRIFDAWHRNGQTVLILDASDELMPIRSQSLAAADALVEMGQWLEDLLKLWVYFEPWLIRSSLLDLDNIFVDEDRQIRLQRLIPEQTDQPLFLNDLVQVWLQLLPPSSLRTKVEQIAQNKTLTVDELRQGLQEQENTLSGGVAADIPAEPPNDSVYQPILLVGLEAAAATHNGKQRDHNEDYYSIESSFSKSQNPRTCKAEGRGLYILCDGMGGHAAGEVASSMAIEKLQAYWAENWHDTLPTAEEIEKAIIFTNQALFEINQTKAAAGNGRMGTTLVMVMIQDSHIAIAHVGDSRCYLLESSGELVQITLDHEVGQREILRGVEPDVAYGRPDSYQLTQAIGPRDESAIAPDIQFFGLREDTLILIASDGLTDRDLLEVHGETLLRPMLQKTVPLAKGVSELIEFGNSYNGHDNITAIAVLVQIDN